MKKTYILLVIILTISVLSRIPLVAQGFFAFTYDQGRDLLVVKQIVETHKFPLIGPTTGLPGIFYGPWWYYFLVPLFVVSNGNPVTITLLFSLIGILTTFFVFVLIKKITGNHIIALGISAVAAMSQVFITASSQIWNPSLVLPLMVFYIYCAVKIFEKSNKYWFFLLGLTSALVFDTEAAFGLMLIISTIISSLFFKKEFLKKGALSFFLGILIVLSPRIIFELRHQLLITHSVESWFGNPKVYQEKLNIAQRFISRANAFYLDFSQTFTQSNKLLSILPALTIIYAITLSKFKIFKDRFFKFMSLLLLFIFIGFTLYPDAVWDYYLAGLALIFLVIFAMSINSLIKKRKLSAITLLVITIIFGFNTKLLSPFSITWQGDGAIFKNQKAVMDYLEKDLHGDYSIYFYTPARFDYPFDYLMSWYYSQKLIDLPKERQKKMFLVIRDDATHLYLPTGWYGDKTRDKTKLLERKIFTGDIIVEKHIFND